MVEFEGFPAGDLRFIAVPDLFFTALVPTIDNLAELKLVLHIIWLRQRRGLQVVTQAQLVADETLARGLAALQLEPEAGLDEALARAVRRGALLRATVQGQAGTHDVYALNSEGSRRALTRLQEGETGEIGTVAVERPAVEPRPNIFELYEDNIGLLSPILADELADAQATYPADWIEDAFRIAAANNVRKWRYVLAILERWATEGRGDGADRQDIETEHRWYTNEEFEQFFKK